VKRGWGGLVTQLSVWLTLSWKLEVSRTERNYWYEHHLQEKAVGSEW